MGENDDTWIPNECLILMNKEFRYYYQRFYVIRGRITHTFRPINILSQIAFAWNLQNWAANCIQLFVQYPYQSHTQSQTPTFVRHLKIVTKRWNSVLRTMSNMNMRLIAFHTIDKKKYRPNQMKCENVLRKITEISEMNNKMAWWLMRVTIQINSPSYAS